jgi:threonyl-tRNA synthetase
MKELASQKLAYERREVSKEEAMQFFGEKGDQYKDRADQ